MRVFQISGIIVFILFLVLTGFLFNKTPVTLNRSEENGKLIWQANACHVCHQICGNGGFLGPDLTNSSEKGKGYFEIMVRQGSKYMPKFKLTEKELNDLFAYLSKWNQQMPKKSLE